MFCRECDVNFVVEEFGNRLADKYPDGLTRGDAVEEFRALLRGKAAPDESDLRAAMIDYAIRERNPSAMATVYQALQQGKR